MAVTTDIVYLSVVQEYLEELVGSKTRRAILYQVSTKQTLRLEGCDIILIKPFGWFSCIVSLTPIYMMALI